MTSILKVDSILSDTTPTVTISDGLSVTGIMTAVTDIASDNDGNTKIGTSALNSLTSGQGTNNTGLGKDALTACTTGNSNVAMTLSILKDEIKEGDAVLFKASRGMNFDLLINKVFKS